MFLCLRENLSSPPWHHLRELLTIAAHYFSAIDSLELNLQACRGEQDAGQYVLSNCSVFKIVYTKAQNCFESVLNIKFNISELPNTLGCHEITYVFIDLPSQLKPAVWFHSGVSAEQLHYLDMLPNKSIKSSCKSHWETIVITGRGIH